jgi:predicted RNase H-like nuclease
VQFEAAGADYVLIALDQPTCVPNATGCRPVERVAGAVVNKIKGGVQPGSRSKIGMFDDGAPIWPFLAKLGARESPQVARTVGTGRFLIEVFPALSLPSLIPELMARGRAAKYNPSNRRLYAPDDWRLVAGALAGHARDLGVDALADWCEAAAALERPRKADQDRLDAAICLVLAILWRRGPRTSMVVLGDSRNGYMVTAVSPVTAPILIAAAVRHGVGYDADWLLSD